jgi:hypothetical protein
MTAICQVIIEVSIRRMLQKAHSFDKHFLYSYIINLSAEAIILKIRKAKINYGHYSNILGMPVFLSLQTILIVFSKATNIILLLKFSKLRASQRQGASL